MKKILVINGPNLNLLGMREQSLYGEKSYAELVRYIKSEACKLSIKATCAQYNGEGEIVTAIQKAAKKFSGIILNAGAYTHTSIAILDALKAVKLPTVEVHLTDITAREEFRKVSFVSLAALKTVMGKGFSGYKEALEFFVLS